ncbi:MAG: hypothetical protein ACRBB3_10685 [Alphaproteobacteria bacterium]
MSEDEELTPEDICCPEGIWVPQAFIWLGQKNHGDHNNVNGKSLIKDLVEVLYLNPQIDIFTVCASSGEKQPFDFSLLRSQRTIELFGTSFIPGEGVMRYGVTRFANKYIFVDREKFTNFLNDKPIAHNVEVDDVTAYPKVKEAKPLGARERDTFLKIIIGMAKDGYGYDPYASRSPLPKELEGVLNRLGISVSDDTIRTKLKEASEFLPRD